MHKEQKREETASSVYYLQYASLREELKKAESTTEENYDVGISPLKVAIVVPDSDLNITKATISLPFSVEKNKQLFGCLQAIYNFLS